MNTLVQQSITQHCEAHGLSIFALAKQIGISANQLGALERGDGVPSLYNLKKLAVFFSWSATSIGKYVLESKPSPTGPKRLRKNGERPK